MENLSLAFTFFYKMVRYVCRNTTFLVGFIQNAPPTYLPLNRKVGCSTPGH